MRPLTTCVFAAAFAALIFGCDEDPNTQAIDDPRNPGPGGTVQPPINPERPEGFDGQACTRNSDCLSDQCTIFGFETDESFGRCARGCNSDADCVGKTPGAVICVGEQIEFGGFCEPTCSVDSDCGHGHICILTSEGQICEVDNHKLYGLTRSGFGNAPEIPSTRLERTLPDLRCDAEDIGFNLWEITFEVPEDAISLMLWVQATTGYLVELSDAQDFDYSALRFTEFYSYSGDDSGFAEFFTGLGEADSILQPGIYSLTAESETAPCVRVYTPTHLGSRIDLNIYNMTSLELHLEDDEQQSRFEEALALASALLNQAGLQIGEVRLMPVSETQQESYHQISSFAQHDDMLDSVDIADLADHEQRSINLFLIEEYVDTLAAMSVVGLAGMVPGTPDNKGTPGGGISVKLGNRHMWDSGVAIVLAHEIGHFLGLEHTSKHHDDGEWTWTDVDFLEDTPACDYELGVDGFDQDCPDMHNLMFGHGGGTEITPGQRRVIRSNPLVY